MPHSVHIWYAFSLGQTLSEGIIKYERNSFSFPHFFSIGRRKAFSIAAFFQLAAALGVVWAPNFWVYALLQFCVGAACHGAFMCCCVLGNILNNNFKVADMILQLLNALLSSIATFRILIILLTYSLLNLCTQKLRDLAKK